MRKIIVVLCLLSTVFLTALPMKAQTISFGVATLPYLTRPPLETSRLKKLQNKCNSIVKHMKISSTGDRLPSHEDLRQLIEVIASYGFPVICEYFDPINYEKIIVFYNDVEASQDGTLTIYQILNSRIIELTFNHKGNVMTLSTGTWEFSLQEAMKFDYSGPERLDYFALQPLGHLIYNQESYGYDPYGFRVLPLGEDFRTLCNDYVLPVKHVDCGVTSQNWNQTVFSAINWEYTFESLLMKERHITIDKANYDHYKNSEIVYAVPASEVETLLQKYFTVPTDTLHLLGSYDPLDNVYAFTGFWGGDDFWVPEVVDKQDNLDGSFTLTIHSLVGGYDESRMRISQLTIMPYSDSEFYYIENQMIGL